MGSIYSKLPSLPNLLTPLSQAELETIKREGREKRLRAYEGASKSELSYSDEYTPPGRRLEHYRAWVQTAAASRYPEAGRKSVSSSPNPADDRASNVRPVTRVVEGGEGAIV
jgi:hypothetical protein